MPTRRDESRTISIRTVGLAIAAVMTLAVGVLLLFAITRSDAASGDGAQTGSRAPADILGATPDAPEPGAADEGVLASEDGRIELFDEGDNVVQVLSYARFEPLEAGRFRIASPRALVRLEGGWTAEVRAESGQLLQRQSRREPESGWFRGDLRVFLYDRPIEEIDAAPERRPEPAVSLFTESLSFNTVMGELRMPDAVRIVADGLTYEGRAVTIVFSEQDRKLLYLRIDETDYLRFEADQRADAEGRADTGRRADAATAPAEPDDSFETEPRDVLYRAVLDGPVRLANGPRVVDADRLELWARTRGGSFPAGAIRDLFTDAAPRPDAPSSGRASAPGAGSGAASSGPNDPVTLTWNGATEVRPLESRPSELARDHLFARFSASGAAPVRVRDSSIDAYADAPSLEYGFTSRRLLLSGSGPRSVVMRLVNRGETHSSRFDADLGEGLAWISGAGALRAIGDSAHTAIGEEPAPRDISWRGRADMRFDDADGRIALREARFTDGVLARERDASVSGESMRIEFATAPGDTVSITRVVVDDNARADAGPDGRLTADRIDVAFRDAPEA
ncbi:MAG: hypothetical protein EA379_00125, partial [Phycisphaerales bacterium]